MNHVITITGDLNDADDSSISNTIDLTRLVFKDWGESFKNLDITYHKLFTALGEVLEEFDKANPHISNWSDRTFSRDGDKIPSRTKILTALSNKLELTEVLDPHDLMEVLWDFIPGSSDYPVHTLYSITALPEEGQITFY